MFNNPFQPTKYEWERRPSIWLSKHAKEMISEEKPVYVSGTRGSGKTTLLRSLSTEHLSQDPKLRNQYSGSKLGWFGQYIQFNATFEEKTGDIKDALRDHSDDMDQRVFCTYFEVSILFQLLTDIISLQDNGFLNIGAKSERAACLEFKSALSIINGIDLVTIEDFSDVRRFARVLLGHFLKTPHDLNAEDLNNVISATPPGSLIRYIKDYVIPSIRSEHFKIGKNLDLYIMVDDCEVLTRSQQKSLNSYIRYTEGVSKWVISFLTDRYDTTSSYIRNTPLSDDDRHPLRLDELTEIDFKEFCDQVTNLRLSPYKGAHFASAKPSKKKRTADFSIDKKFGEINYNERFEIAIRNSENKHITQFQTEVENVKSHLLNYVDERLWKRFHCDFGQTPYIEYAVITARQIRLQNKTFEEQKSLIKTIAGLQGAAYIALCAKYGLRPIYAGADCARLISHRCIRDHLDFMGTLFSELLPGSTSPVSDKQFSNVTNKFLNHQPFSISVQDRAIRETSRSKYVALENLKSSEPEIDRLVRALASLQQEFEHDTTEWRAVRRKILGKFSVPLVQAVNGGMDPKLVEKVRLVLGRLEFDRYIKFNDTRDLDSAESVGFELHKRLRPHLRCSHTGPFERALELHPSVLVEVMRGGTEFDAKGWAKQKYQTLLKDKQLEPQQDMGF